MQAQTERTNEQILERMKELGRVLDDLTRICELLVAQQETRQLAVIMGRARRELNDYRKALGENQS